MAYSKRRGDVEWYLPKSKINAKPIAYSTKATSDLIAVLSKTYETVQDVYNAINYDPEAKEILRKYIDKGYGNTIAQTLFK